MKDMPITEAREELTSMPERLGHTHEAVAVTRRGKPVLAILPWNEYEMLVETLEILGDQESMSQLRQAIQQVKHGKTIGWEAAKKKLAL